LFPPSWGGFTSLERLNRLARPLQDTDGRLCITKHEQGSACQPWIWRTFLATISQRCELFSTVFGGITSGALKPAHSTSTFESRALINCNVTLLLIDNTIPCHAGVERDRIWYRFEGCKRVLSATADWLLQVVTRVRQA
jgi:hypothetical protein